MKASGGMRASPSKNTNAKRVKNWAVLRWLVHLVTQDDQVGDVSGFLMRGGSCCGHDVVDDTQQGDLFSFNWGVFNPICFELPVNMFVQFDVSLGVVGDLGAWGVLPGGGLPQSPPMLRNRFLTKSFHLALGVLGATDSVPVDLEDLDKRDGWIL